MHKSRPDSGAAAKKRSVAPTTYNTGSPQPRETFRISRKTAMTTSPAPAAAGERTLLRRDEGGVTTLTLNRPAQFNALSQTLLGELQNAVEAVGRDPAVRVVVLGRRGQGILRRPRSEGNALRAGTRKSSTTFSGAPDG
jgi:hypothetical protein